MGGHSMSASERTRLIIHFIQNELAKCQQLQTSYENAITSQLDEPPLISNWVSGQKTGGDSLLPSERNLLLIALFKKWLTKFHQLQSSKEAPLHPSTSGPHNPNTIEMENTHFQNQMEFSFELFELYGRRLSKYLMESWYQRNEVISTQSNDIRVTEKAVDGEGEVPQSLFTLLIGLSGNGRNS